MSTNMNEIDARVQNLMALARKASEDVKKTEEIADKEWVTNCAFSFHWNGSDVKNIQTMSINDVFRAAQWLKLVEQAGELVDIGDEPVFAILTKSWQQAKIADWEKDLKKRVARINLQEKKTKLKNIEDALSGLISTELRTRMELDRITKQLESM